ncbi:retrovirus-related pol polyprotein from transposon TNT 1-94, partial [Tanacetum coccineum]
MSVKEKASNPSPTKKIRKGKVAKISNEKSSFKLVDEEEEVQPSPEPHVDDDDSGPEPQFMALIQNSSGPVLTLMAPDQSSSGPTLYEMTTATHIAGLVPKPPSSATFVPPTRNDWDTLFQLVHLLQLQLIKMHQEADHDIEVAHMGDNLENSNPIPEPNSEESFSRNEEGIDFDESFALVARLKVVRIFIAFAAHMNIVVYQIDVKTAFLNGIIRKKVY